MMTEKDFEIINKVFDEYCEKNGIIKKDLNIHAQCYDPINKVVFLLRQREDQKGLSFEELIANDLPMPVSFEISANGVIDRRNEPEKLYSVQ